MLPPYTPRLLPEVAARPSRLAALLRRLDRLTLRTLNPPQRPYAPLR